MADVAFSPFFQDSSGFCLGTREHSYGKPQDVLHKMYAFLKCLLKVLLTYLVIEQRRAMSVNIIEWCAYWPTFDLFTLALHS